VRVSVPNFVLSDKSPTAAYVAEEAQHDAHRVAGVRRRRRARAVASGAGAEPQRGARQGAVAHTPLRGGLTVAGAGPASERPAGQSPPYQPAAGPGLAPASDPSRRVEYHPARNTESDLGVGSPGAEALDSQGGRSPSGLAPTRGVRGDAPGSDDHSARPTARPVSPIFLDAVHVTAEAPEDWSEHPWRPDVLAAAWAAWRDGMQPVGPDEVPLPWLGAGSWKVHARAGRGVRYELFAQGANYVIELGLATGRVRVQARSEWIAQDGPEGVLRELRALHGRLYDRALPFAACWTCQHLDVTADFVGLPVVELERRQWVARANASEHDGVADEGGTTGRTWRTGFTVGARDSAVSAVIYDKGIELARNPRPWVDALHREHGWDGTEQRTRVEFRLHGRRGLTCWGQVVGGQWAGYDLTDPEVALGDWRAWAPQAWTYLTSAVPGGWLRLATPDAADTNRSRWATDERWRAVQSLAVVGTLERGKVRTLRLAEAHRRAQDRMLAAATTLLALRVAEGAPMPADLAEWQDRSLRHTRIALAAAAARYTRRTWRPAVMGDYSLSDVQAALLARVEARAALYAAV